MSLKPHLFTTKSSSDRLKDGKVAAEQCSRYRVNSESLEIRDVAEEDAGKYTVLVRNKEHGLYQNLTLTLTVNGEKTQFSLRRHQYLILPYRLLNLYICVGILLAVRPQIGEKAASSQDPGSVPRGSKRTLLCTSHAVPAPHMQWLWHPCPSKGL